MSSTPPSSNVQPVSSSPPPPPSPSPSTDAVTTNLWKRDLSADAAASPLMGESSSWPPFRGFLSPREQNPSDLSTVSSFSDLSSLEESQSLMTVQVPVSDSPLPVTTAVISDSVAVRNPNPNAPSSNYRHGRNHQNRRPQNYRRNDGSFYHNQYNRIDNGLFWLAPHWNQSPNMGSRFSSIWPPQQWQWGIFPGATAPPVAPPPEFFPPNQFADQFYIEGNARPYIFNPPFHPVPAPRPVGLPQLQVPPFFPGTAMLQGQDPSLMAQIRMQIEYYFSDKNLMTDGYLKRQMDSFGWVDLRLIAGFRKVAALTKDLDMIRKALMFSSIVEHRGDKMRRRFDWKKWTLASQNLNSLETGMRNMQLGG